MTVDIHQQRILILDFGSQYTQLIARRVRELGVYCEIHPYDMPDEAINKFHANGIILSGGPETVIAETTPRASMVVFEQQCPVLGICYGMQTMAAQLGGEVQAATHREFGYAEVVVKQVSRLLDGIEDRVGKGFFDVGTVDQLNSTREESNVGYEIGEQSAQTTIADVTAVASKSYPILDVWMSHGDQVTKVPEGFDVVASTETAPIAVMADSQRQFYGVQFHPEVTHTHQGARILSRFIHEVCGCERLWTAENIIEDSIAHVREQVGSDHVILGLSGGVDSSVVAALLHKAIGDQLTCVFVDNGLLRLNEAEQVMTTMNDMLGVNVIKVDASDQFLSALAGINDPEKKRKITGNVFIEIFENEANKIQNAKWLAQGTIYPDVIESAGAKTGKAHVIKSHHNVGGLPETMRLKLLEPLRELFKDEVRKLGLELGLPYEMVYRHPFPGPGLTVRILGEVTPERAEVLRHADAIFIEELRNADWYHKVSQAFAVYLPVKSVGVVGDARRYDDVIALRAVETVDFMTAHWAHLPYELLSTVSHRIINEVSGVSRVVYDVSGKPPATIEWE